MNLILVVGLPIYFITLEYLLANSTNFYLIKALERFLVKIILIPLMYFGTYFGSLNFLLKTIHKSTKIGLHFLNYNHFKSVNKNNAVSNIIKHFDKY